MPANQQSTPPASAASVKNRDARVAAEKARLAKAQSKTTAKGKVTKRRLTSAKSNQERYERIAEAAYYRAEQRDFAPGHEVEDWLAAEKEIDSKRK